MSNNIFFLYSCQKENTALAVFSFCIAAADENCKFGDVGMREARARGALRRRRKPCRGAPDPQDPSGSWYDGLFGPCFV